MKPLDTRVEVNDDIWHLVKTRLSVAGVKYSELDWWQRETIEDAVMIITLATFGDSGSIDDFTLDIIRAVGEAE